MGSSSRDNVSVQFLKLNPTFRTTSRKQNDLEETHRKDPLLSPFKKGRKPTDDKGGQPLHEFKPLRAWTPVSRSFLGPPVASIAPSPSAGLKCALPHHATAHLPPQTPAVAETMPEALPNFSPFITGTAAAACHHGQHSPVQQDFASQSQIATDLLQ